MPLALRAKLRRKQLEMDISSFNTVINMACEFFTSVDPDKSLREMNNPFHDLTAEERALLLSARDLLRSDKSEAKNILIMLLKNWRKV